MSKLRPAVAANWKMFKTPQESYSFVSELRIKLLDMGEVDIILFVPYTSLFHIRSLFADGNVKLGAQNVHWESEGAFTGEISPAMLRACGTEWVILGHSERRHLFRETNDDIRRKVIAVLKEGLHPILCVGETSEERQSNRTVAVLTDQLNAVLGELDEDGLGRMLFAYEPVWAIGTGISAKPDQIEDAHRSVRNLVKERFPKKGLDIRILYGGSVSTDNVRELIAVDGVDGFLVGGASLELDSFVSIIENVEEYQLERA